MAITPKKVVVIGLDASMPHLIEQHVKEGHLPAFKKLIENGVFADNCLAPFPTITPPNWTAIATGAFGGTSGVTDFHYQKEGADPDNRNTFQHWDADKVKAEHLWTTLDKVGKKCIVMNYPVSWPSKMKNGIIVGGRGFTPGEDHADKPHLDATANLCADQIVSTGIYPGQIRGEWRDAQGWKNGEKMGSEPLEMEIELNFPHAVEKPAPTRWWVAAMQSKGNGTYDKVALAPTKDCKEAFFSLGVGEWARSNKAVIGMPDGTEREVRFGCKLMELSADADEFRLLIGQMTDYAPTGGWSSPAQVAAELKTDKGCLHYEYGTPMYMQGMIDQDTLAEIMDNCNEWFGNAAATLMKNHEWDLFISHEHTQDFLWHAVMTDMDSTDGATRTKAWDTVRKALQSNDRYVARIVEAAGPDALVILVSDHGAVPDGPMFDPYLALEPAGLTVRKSSGSEAEMDPWVRMLAKTGLGTHNVPDYTKSKAVPNRTSYVYINLKGRDPNGIVDPADYEKVQQEIINALYDYKDPETGKRPVALALSRRDARMIGLHGDKIGDVVYAVQPWFGAQHGPILPTARYGSGFLHPLFTMTGPGIKKGQKLERTCWLPDIVPTICYLMDWPVPTTAEGAVLYQALRDPNFKEKQISKLEMGIARMGGALDRATREPWDRHDCA